ncbi:hypothetical protein L1987_27212 [Smallanthus sonchifolius]|uniref:Uncharacterized protein n=1 Tax=Smallanthus sonchifolius TaxID=185202 RepID=A0ACB9IA50_9ASTR|nr:hypothetical protein L1987_27212 [Smallanthus sonchifolius]
MSSLLKDVVLMCSLEEKAVEFAKSISFSKFTNKQSDPLMVNDSEDEQNAQTDPELKTKLEKKQKKSKSKKMTDEKNVKYEGRVKEKQRDDVRSMRFGKLLSLKVGGIPSKLGHYVVDKFDPERMEINLGNVQVKYVAPPDIVKRISQSSDDDNILLKLDFLVLFMTTMVEIQKHGKCKLDFIHYITNDTDIGVNSKFTGSLTILTLLYVDRVKCPSENVERKMRPIEFWTMKALCSREECEINNGGFGLGELRKLYVDLKGDESDVDKKCNEKEANKENLFNDFFQPDNLTGHLSKLDVMFDIIVRDKKRFERALCEPYSFYPENKEVKEFVEKYKSIYKEIIDVEKDVADTNSTHFFNNNLEEIIKCENAKKKVGTEEKEKGIDTEVKEKESIDTEEKENEIIDTDVKVKEIIDTEKKEKEIIDPTLPNFSFKLSQST